MTTVLSSKQIVEAVASGAIRIAYYAIRKPDGTVESFASKRFVKPAPAADDDDADKLIREYFLESLEPDSLTLHVGPYAAVETQRKGDAAAFLLSRADQTILQVKTAGVLEIYPREFVLVGTSEYIEVGRDIGGALYSNVRNTDIGLTHISTIVDPTWQGKLQIGLTNPTPVSKELMYLDPVCIVRFHRLAEPVDDAMAQRFRDRRPHYGENWWTVEAQQGRAFFPVRKEYAAGGENAAKAKTQKAWQERIDKAKKLGGFIGLTSAGTALVFAITAFVRMGDTSKYGERLALVEKNLSTVNDMQKSFHVIKTGSRIIDFDDPNTLRFIVPLDEAQAEPPVILMNISGVDSSRYAFRIEYSYTNVNQKVIDGATVTVNPLGSPPPSGRQIASWFVARPARRP